MRAGIGFVPEDRKRQGLVLGMRALENVTLPTLRALARAGWLRAGAERALADDVLRAAARARARLDAVTAGLSGGNQQKMVLAKWLAARCGVLILDEPTRGVDVGAKAEIHALIGRAGGGGDGVLLISSELPELVVAVDARPRAARRTSGRRARAREATTGDVAADDGGPRSAARACAPDRPHRSVSSLRAVDP